MRIQINDYVVANVLHLPHFYLAPPIQRVKRIINPYSPDAIAVLDSGAWFRVDLLAKVELEKE